MKLIEIIGKYLKHLTVLGRSKLTVRGAKYGLKTFLEFLEDEKVFSVEQLTPEIMAEYQQDLAFRITRKGTPLSLRSQSQLLLQAKNFTKYLLEQELMIRDPSAKIKLPKKPRRLPKVILSTSEMKQLLNGSDVQSNRGYRNRIILEILYDTGIRRAEVAGLKLRDFDLDGGYLHIRSGKGDKDRVVPLSSRVSNLIRSYLITIRPTFLQGKDEGHFILNRWGNQMNVNGVWAVVKRCASQAGIKKNITTHTFRHTCATHMLKYGAPIRHVQELLGHESLETTQLYTHVTINDLKEIHTKYHPSESMPVR